MSDCGPRTGAVLKRFVSAPARNLSLSLAETCIAAVCVSLVCAVVHGPLCVVRRFGASSLFGGIATLADLKVKLEKMESSAASAGSLGKLLCGGLARAEVTSPGKIAPETATQEQNTQLTMATAAETQALE